MYCLLRPTLTLLSPPPPSPTSARLGSAWLGAGQARRRRCRRRITRSALPVSSLTLDVVSYCGMAASSASLTGRRCTCARSRSAWAPTAAAWPPPLHSASRVRSALSVNSSLAAGFCCGVAAATASAFVLDAVRQLTRARLKLLLRHGFRLRLAHALGAAR